MKISVGRIISFVSVLFWCVSAQNSEEDYLKVHNAARKGVGVKPLKWDKELESYARAHLNKHVEDCKLESSDGPYGENLVRGTGFWKNLTGKEAVELWVSEKQYYDEKSNSCLGGDDGDDDKCFGYTQVVWNTTTHVGCARVRCYNGSIMVSCNYNPPGNYRDKRPY
ncbi:pathogenesis-related protein 1A-like [Arachis stenosperma]|uniref:pathogenesis-related protein 1A-like n=1 Tax=Arachis stenosperma TaxID=217475 RepID=UPI0025ACECBE|nr:pathogenesis-related protein 1A-like [Arachis stenosperma]